MANLSQHQQFISPLTCHCPTSLESARNKVDSKTWCRKVKIGRCRVGALQNTGHKFDGKKGRNLGTRVGGTRDDE